MFERSQRIWRMSTVAGMTYDEIAKKEHVSRATVGIAVLRFPRMSCPFQQFTKADGSIVILAEKLQRKVGASAMSP
jgi:transposase